MALDHVPEVFAAVQTSGLVFLHQDHAIGFEMPAYVLVKFFVSLPIDIHCQSLIVVITGTFQIMWRVGHY
jgi:hypothetical protein